MNSSHHTYGIVGKGRLAGHLLHYFRLKNMHVVQWYRGQTRTAQQALSQANIVLILINDDEIESFIKQNSWLKNKIILHCSGSLVTKLAQGFHPHFNFTQQLYKEETYEKIPFVTESGWRPYGISPFEIFGTLLNGYRLCISKTETFSAYTEEMKASAFSSENEMAIDCSEHQKKQLIVTSYKIKT